MQNKYKRHDSVHVRLNIHPTYSCPCQYPGFQSFLRDSGQRHTPNAIMAVIDFQK
jgi:hypothetical protein